MVSVQVGDVEEVRLEGAEVDLAVVREREPRLEVRGSPPGVAEHASGRCVEKDTGVPGRRDPHRISASLSATTSRGFLLPALAHSLRLSDRSKSKRRRRFARGVWPRRELVALFKQPRSASGGE